MSNNDIIQPTTLQKSKKNICSLTFPRQYKSEMYDHFMERKFKTEQWFDEIA